MKRVFLIVSIVFISNILTNAQSKEFYFKFVEPNKQVINTVITKTISIDRVKNDTVYAYANEMEFEKFKQLGYNAQLLPAPSSSNSKAIVMATSIEQMSGWNRYPTYETYRAMLKKYAQDYPSLCMLDSIGTSVQGRKLYLIKISDNVNLHEAEPEFLYSSTMHGDETTGFILMLRLIDYLLNEYATNPDIQELVNTTQIYIVPNTNPDGTYYGGNSNVSNSRRYNGNSIDLNRNFPDPRTGQHPDGNQWQVENIAMMNLAKQHNFVMAGNFHGGAELANYPWDTWSTYSNAHADNTWFKQVSRNYASTAQSASPSGYFTDESNGITEGGDWYVITGGRQDYMNYNHHCREVTFEISSTKCPDSNQLPNFWNYNYQSIIDFMKMVHTGFNGTITNQNGNPIKATITVTNHDKDNSFVVTDSTHGTYYRPIAPGNYTVTYSANGYISQNHSIIVSNYNSSTVKDVVLIEKESASLTGTITDAQSGEPIYNAIVSIEGLCSTTTNTNGQFTFNSLYEGDYTLSISCTNYTTLIKPITLSAGENIQNLSLNISHAENFESEIPDGISFSGGDWIRTNETAYNGLYSIRSAQISHNSSTSMQATLNFSEAGIISFARKVSSESGYDFLEFYIDNTKKGSWSGQVDWEVVTYSVSAGNHTIKWVYRKDQGVSNGSDCAWVDFIETPATTQDVIFTTTINGTPYEGLMVLFNGTNQTTNAQGNATFSNVERGNNLPYTVKLADSVLATGNLNVYWCNVNQLVNILRSYTVVFNVKDENNTSLSNAQVDINGVSVLTNTNGVASFSNVPFSNSTSYSVSKRGFVTSNGTVTIHSDTVFNVTLAVKTSCDVTFNVTSDGGKLANAQINFYNQQLSTNSDGKATFSNIPISTNHSYTVSKDGYTSFTGNITAMSDTTINVDLINNSCNVTFKVTYNGNNVNNALVSFNNQQYNTNSNGTASFNNVLKNVSLNYSVSKNGYYTITNYVTVTSDTTISINLTKDNCTVTFVVTSNGSNLNGATIDFNNIQKKTNNKGIATFGNIALATELSYTISKTGYTTFEGYLNAIADTTININLTPSSIGNISLEKIAIWPNPFSNTLNIDLSKFGNELITVTVYNMLGQEVEQLLHGTINHELQWNPSNQQKGIYFVKIRTNHTTITRKVVFK